MDNTDDVLISDEYTEHQLLQLLARTDALTSNIEKILAFHRELRRKIGAKYEEICGRPAPPPPPETGGRVIPLLRRKETTS